MSRKRLGRSLSQRGYAGWKVELFMKQNLPSSSIVIFRTTVLLVGMPRSRLVSRRIKGAIETQKWAQYEIRCQLERIRQTGSVAGARFKLTRRHQLKAATDSIFLAPVLRSSWRWWQSWMNDVFVHQMLDSKKGEYLVAQTANKKNRSKQQTQKPKQETQVFPLMWNSGSTAQGGGGSFKNRKRIGEIDCCEWRMSEQKHWPTD